jgi:epoxyqueuosine reductase
MPIKEDILAEADSLGFSLAGVTRPERPSHFAAFQRWLEQGYHGQMAYLSRPESVRRRQDPKIILAEAQSVLSLGVLYSSSALRPDFGQAGQIRGRVAAYAWGKDYHLVLPPRLDALAEKIAAIAGHPVRQKRYTDSGPLLERDLAQRSGLGWIGKNTSLISPRLGSYFFLAELLLDEEIEPDTPFPFDRCGSCQRCIQACPTGCILPDRTIDATRCISYLTIENKQEIPLDLRSAMGDWIFGCDICQEVCPWNLRFAPENGDPSFEPRPEIASPDLLEELHLTPEGFNRKFKWSPVQRSRRRGYLRNVCVALGNRKDRRAVRALAETLESEAEGLVRRHAAWALGKVGTQVARRLLEKALHTEIDPGVQSEIRQALTAGDK